MADPLATVLKRRRNDVVVLGGEAFLTVPAALDLLDEAERCGIAVLGLEGFMSDASAGRGSS